MPRQRMVKPEFFESDSLAECSYAARLAFIGLWCQSDDKGHVKASVRKLRKLIFPLEDMTDAEFEGYLAELEAVGCIKHYEVEGEGYIEVVNFSVYQRVQHPSKTTIPDPPETLARTKITHHFIPYDAPLCEDYGSPTVVLREQPCNGSPSVGLTLNKERKKEESILTTSKILSPHEGQAEVGPSVEKPGGKPMEGHCPLCDAVVSKDTHQSSSGLAHDCPNCGPIKFTSVVWR